LVDDSFSGREVLRLRSGFRLRAQTPADRLNFDSSSLLRCSDSLSIGQGKESKARATLILKGV